MKECVCTANANAKKDNSDCNEKKNTLGMFIIQEEKQEITISHNMLNSLNDTIAHTGEKKSTHHQQQQKQHQHQPHKYIVHRR